MTAQNNNITHISKNGVGIIQFQNLLKYEPVLVHGFTTRLGGVSAGDCRSLNMGFNRDDTKENVLANYKRVSETLEIDYRKMVFSNQVHENRIRAVDESDRGKGILYDSDIIGYDGLVTASRDVVLVTFYADCVPIMLFDPKNKVICSAHSGWRGTVKEIAGEAVTVMEREYGCKAEDIEAAVGPSIGKCCFEVGVEVYDEFITKLEWSSKFCCLKENNKWNIDLHGIIRQTLINRGVDGNRVCMGNICTMCNTDMFFSYRGDKGKTGSMAAIMNLRPD